MKQLKKLILAGLLLAAAPLAFAQTDPSVTFGASVTNANGSLSTTLNWSTSPVASSCTASGSPSWTGTKAASGSVDLPAITLSGTYTLSLSCTWPGDTSATIKWVAPTTNTDGSALAKCANASVTGSPCLAFFNVYRRVNNPDLSTNAEVTKVADPNATQFTKSGIGAGTHYFGVFAVNGNGVSSDISNVTNKVLVASTTKSANVTLTVNPKPGPPTNLTVE